MSLSFSLFVGLCIALPTVMLLALWVKSQFQTFGYTSAGELCDVVVFGIVVIVFLVGCLYPAIGGCFILWVWILTHLVHD